MKNINKYTLAQKSKQLVHRNHKNSCTKTYKSCAPETAKLVRLRHF